MSEMKFSVLMSAYGADDPGHLSEALASILCQTRMPDQIVLVADGPLTEALNRILDDYAGRHKGLFTMVRLAGHAGPANAWNRGLEQCAHDLVARMDADDISLPERFEKQVAFLQTHPEVDVVGTYYVEFEEDRNRPVALYKPPACHAAILKYARLRNPLCHPSVMYRKHAVAANGGYIRLSGFVDYYLWVRMLQSGCVFANIPEVLLNYRGGRNVMVRRGGLGYIRNEWAFLRTCYKAGFISFWNFAGNFILRPVVRIMPVFARKIFYQRLLRHSVGTP